MEKCCICNKELKETYVWTPVESYNFGLNYSDILCIQCDFEIQNYISELKKKKQ